MFSTASLTAPVATGSKYISAGINDDVKVAGFSAGESSKGTPFLEIEFRKGEDSATKDKLYFTEKSTTSSLQRVLHLLVDGAGVARAAFDAAGEGAANLNDYANKLNLLLPGAKPFRMKFKGEEYLYNGEVKVGKRIPFQDFAEPAGATPSILKYDPSNKNDYTPVAKPDALPGGEAADNSLPF